MPTTTSTTDADIDLIAACAAVVDVPKAGPPSSFELHAPLEVLARALLLGRVAPDRRDEARARLRWVAAKYEAAAPSATEAAPPLVAAPDDIAVSLAAAGHAPILLSLRPRVAAVPATFGDALVATELARYPTWSLEWPRTRSAEGTGSGDLAERLASPRSPGDPGSDFIYPTMHLTETSGLASEVLDAPLRGLGVAEARRTLLRVAARSMLQDNPDAAPYGWTHCLTMPQAMLVTADEHGVDPDLAIAVAATYVLGFRSTQGRVRLEDGWVPERATSAGRAWRARADERDAIVEELATFAALHEDAHVAKYTLACFDAADVDPDAGPLFLAAAAHLHDWWRNADAVA